MIEDMKNRDIEHRLELMEEKRRHRRAEEWKRRNVPTWAIAVTVISVILAGLMGYMIGLEEGRYSDAEVDNTSFSFDGYNIRFVSPEENDAMEGNFGFTYKSSSNDIWIRKKLLLEHDWKQIKRTCEHELLHNLGIGEDHHPVIGNFEKQVDSKACTSLMEAVKRP